MGDQPAFAETRERCCHRTTHHYEEDETVCCHVHQEPDGYDPHEPHVTFETMDEAMAWLRAPDSDGESGA